MKNSTIVMRIRKYAIASIALYIIIICACAGHTYPQSLTVADSLCHVNPDSALSLLINTAKDIDYSPEKTRMYYRLLLIQAKDKTDRIKPEEEKENIATIVDYYEHNSDRVLLPIAYYYAGRIYAELQEAPQALDYFQKANNALPDGENIDLRSRIYSQMGYLLYFQEVYDEALKMFYAAYQANKGTNDTISMIYDLRDLSTLYEAKNKHDKALKYLKKAYYMANMYKNKYMIGNIESYMSSLYEILNQPDSASKYLQKSLNNIGIKDSSSTYSLIIDIQKLKGDKDSVLYYCKKIENVGNVYAKKHAYRQMTEIYLERKHYTEANRCFRMYNIYKDSVNYIKRTDVIARMNAQYNYHIKEKENILLQEKDKRNKIIIISSSTIAIMLLAGLVIYIRYSIKKQKEQSRNYKKAQQILNDKLRKSEQNVDKSKLTITSLENRIKDINKEKTELEKELEREKERLLSPDNVTAIGIKNRDKTSEAIKNSPIYRSLYRMADKSSHKKTSDEDWGELEKLLNREYDKFTDKLNSLCKLSETEYHVSMLIKLNFEPSRIAELVCCSLSNISTIRRRLYIKVFGKKAGTKEWDEFIQSL